MRLMEKSRVIAQGALAMARREAMERPLLAALALSAVLLRLWFWFYTDRTWEDSLITALHSENFYSGLGLTHFRVDETRPVHGFTSPISVLIPLVGDFFGFFWGHLGFGLTLQRIVSAVAGGVTVWLGGLLMEALAPPRGRIGATLLACGYLAWEHHQILWGMAGMETQCAEAILLWSMWLFATDQRKALGWSLGWCVLARPDFALWPLIVGMVIAWEAWLQRSAKPLWAVVWRAVALYSPWVIFTTLYYGSPVPNTIVAKSAGSRYWWEYALNAPEMLRFMKGQLWHKLFTLLGPAFGGHGVDFTPLAHNELLEGVALTLLGLGLASAFLLQQRARLTIYVFVIGFGFYQINLVPYIFGWYLPPLMGVSVVLMAVTVGEWASWLSAWRPLRYVGEGAAIAGAGAYLLPFLMALPATFYSEKLIQTKVEDGVRKQMGIYMGQVMGPRQTVVCEPLGYMSYYSRRHIWDFPGLASRTAARIVREEKIQHGTKGLLMALIERLQPDYAVLRTSEVLQFDTYPSRRLYRLKREFQVDRAEIGNAIDPQRNIDTHFYVLERITPREQPGQ